MPMTQNNWMIRVNMINGTIEIYNVINKKKHNCVQVCVITAMS